MTSKLDDIFPTKKAMTILQKLALFNGLFDEEFNILLDVCQVHKFKDKSIICREGEPSNSMYITLSGKIVIDIESFGTVHVIKTGEILGEIGLITKQARSATATASGPIVLLEIKKSDFNLILEQEPRVSFIIMRNIAKILAERLTYCIRLRTHDENGNPLTPEKKLLLQSHLRQ
jgi:CRP/FNR family transcriptional regulator, cyclic AMP receptor protein